MNPLSFRSWRPRRLGGSLCLEPLEDRTLLDGNPFPSALALALTPAAPAQQAGRLTVAGEQDFFQLTLTGPARLTARVAGAGSLDPRLSLYDEQGGLLLTSDNASTTDTAAEVVQHLIPGTYYLAIVAADGATGNYQLFAQLAEALPPLDHLPAQGASAMLSGDFNGDGRPDLATVGSGGVSVLLGLGDGSFAPAQHFAISEDPGTGVTVSSTSLLSGDFNGDGHLDLATSITRRNTANNRFLPGSVSVLLGRGDGTFGPPMLFAIAGPPKTMLSGDFNGDGRPDLVTFTGGYETSTTATLPTKVSVLLGLGDGSFAPEHEFDIGVDASNGNSGIVNLFVGDFNGDRRLDLAAAGAGVSVLLGMGDGTFAPERRTSVPQRVFHALSADLNGDGRTDLVTAPYPPNGGSKAGNVSVWLGSADGTLVLEPQLDVGGWTAGMLAGDFNGDGRLDLVLAVDVNFGSGTYWEASVLLGKGDGTFAPVQRLNIPAGTFTLLSGDFNGDGHVDFVACSTVTESVSVRLGRGDGTFAPDQRYGIPIAYLSSPIPALSADFNGAGHHDFAVLSPGSGVVAVFLSLADGTFAAQQSTSVGDFPIAIVSGDFNNDGRPDLATANFDHGDVSVVLGLGDGTFATERRFVVQGHPYYLVSGDFNGDGRLDLVTSSVSPNEVSLLLGLGDGTFTLEQHLAGFFGRLLTGDFNGDGRLDVASFDGSAVSVLLGRADGTLAPAWRSPVLTDGFTPLSLLLSGDFNDDDILDLATVYGTSSVDSGVVVILGNGDGTFAPAQRFATQGYADKLVSGDFNGDGRLDLATDSSSGNFDSDSFMQLPDASVLLGLGDGTFAPAKQFLIGPVSFDGFLVGASLDAEDLLSGDFNGDGRWDLAASIRTYDPTTGDSNNGVSILLSRGDGTFAETQYSSVAQGVSLLSDDFNGDGHLDLAAISPGAVSVLLGLGDGTFASEQHTDLRSINQFFAVSADFNSDGRLDLAIDDVNGNDVSVILNLENGGLVSPQDLGSNPNQATPLLADLDGDGIRDSAIVNQAGQILFRRGHADTLTFDPPLVLNSVKRPARAICVLNGELAALDRDDFVSLYSLTRDDQVVATSPEKRLPTGILPVRVAAADLNGDGRDDLVVANAGSQDVSVFLSRPFGGYLPPQRLPAGGGVAALQLVDLDGSGTIDIVTGNARSGDVSVLLNTGKGAFEPSRYRAGTQLYGQDEQGLRAQERTSDLAAGDFNEDGFPDLIAANTSAHGFTLLRGTRHGGFVNPAPADSVLTAGMAPILVRAGRFTGDSHLDLAVAFQNSNDIWIYAGDGKGGFGRPFVFDTGSPPTGLTVVDGDGKMDLNRDGKTDLLVGNGFGDVLALLGNGDGTFHTSLRVDRHTVLAVADLNGDGHDDVVWADPSLDRVSVQFARTGQTFEQDRQQGLLAPDAVRSADLNRDGIPDLIVANGGANDVLVYLGTGNGLFGQAQQFSVGTNPTGLTVTYLNDQQIVPSLPPGVQGPLPVIDPNLDLVVADQGSNDVAVLLGQGQGADWTFKPGPRLQAGTGPVATAVLDLTGPRGAPDGIPDILVSNSQANTLSLVPAVGGGFFDDVRTLTRSTGLTPGAIIPLPGPGGGSSGVGVVNGGSNSITMFPDFVHSDVEETIGTGGVRPVAAVAGDLNQDGFTDILVANNGDGAITLLEGGEGGFKVLLERILLHPTDLALGSDPNECYVTQEGEDAVTQFTLDFGTPLPKPPGPPPPPAPPGVELHIPTDSGPPREQALLPTVALLVSPGGEVGPARAPGAGDSAAESGPASEPAPGPSSGGGDEEDGDLDREGRPVMGSAQENRPDFVIGLDEALRRSDAVLRELVVPARPAPQQPPRQRDEPEAAPPELGWQTPRREERAVPELTWPNEADDAAVEVLAAALLACGLVIEPPRRQGRQE